MTTLEKIKCLEEYVAINNSVVDSVIEITINKLLAREFERVSELKARLINDISEFEKQYVLKSDDFYQKYEKGMLADSMDFVEWAATVEMLENVKRQHKLS
ncbi:MAG: hypothetical protein HQK70_08185 [Desulfamplus sp.]|nr:hypothetical protein [Desulfamplus sp.]